MGDKTSFPETVEFCINFKDFTILLKIYMVKINKTQLRGEYAPHLQLGMFWFVSLPLQAPGSTPVRVVACDKA